MKERFKKVQTYLAITISAFMLLFPTCLLCSNFAGARLLSTDLSFENPGQEDLFSVEQNGLKGFVSAVFAVKFFPRPHLSEQFIRLFFKTPFLDQNALILLC